MDFSQEQEGALAAVAGWMERGDKPSFYLAGYAGTGKTTLAKTFAERCGGRVRFAALTGKAALVLRQKGCTEATTIHKLIYVPKDKSRANLLELQKMHVEESAKEIPSQGKLREIQEAIDREKTNLRRPSFALNEASDITGSKLVVIDEVSMVGVRMAEDLLSFGVPVLVLGDPAQLPPVAEGGYFTAREADWKLTQVHRQAAGSPVLELATRVRRGEALPLGEWGETKVVAKGSLSLSDAAGHDQILCGTNKMRRNLNRKIRTEILGHKSHLPEPGDKLVCLRNDHEAGLLNGSQWTCRESWEMDSEKVGLVIAGDEGELTVEAHRAHFEDREIPFWARTDAQEFDFGYAMTVHKSQGSAWPRVLVVDESHVFREHARRWLYTAVTRAAKSVTVVKTV